MTGNTKLALERTGVNIQKKGKIFTFPVGSKSVDVQQISTRQETRKFFPRSCTTNENANIMFNPTVTLTYDSDLALNKHIASQGSIICA